ncbi:hypothetical protein D3C85_777340 [compost metagenome]
MPARQQAINPVMADLRLEHPALVVALGHPPAMGRHLHLRQLPLGQGQLLER